MYEVRITKKEILGYKLLEITPINANKKRLAFFQHGYTTSKDDVRDHAMKLAQRGFHVICLDAYGHGERETEPLPKNKGYMVEMEFYYKIIVETAKDYIKLYDEHYQKEYPTFSMFGESMGGQINYMVAIKKPELKYIGAIVGAPSLIEYGFEEIKEQNTTDPYNGMLDNLEEWDAFYHKEKFLDKNIYMICGTRDTVVPRKWSKKFVEEMEAEFGYRTYQYTEVERGHWIPPEDLEEMWDYAEKNFA